MTRTEWNSTNLIREWIECISNERDLERISFGAGALPLPQNGKPSQHFHNNIIVNTGTSLQWWYRKETDCKSSWRWDDGLGALSRWAAALSQDPKRPKMSLHAVLMIVTRRLFAVNTVIMVRMVIVMKDWCHLSTLPPERTQPKKLCTANFPSGTLKTLIDRPLWLKKQIFLTTSCWEKALFLTTEG